MKTLNTYKFQILAALLLVGGFVSSRGGVAPLMPLVKVLIPVIVGVLLFKLVKKRLAGKMQELMKKQMEAMGVAGGFPGGNAQNFPGFGKQAAAGAGGGKVIDLCPKCGSYAKPGHKCKK